MQLFYTYSYRRLARKKLRGLNSKNSISPGNVNIFRPLSLILVAFFTKSIISKQFEDSQIKRMCIFHCSRAARGLRHHVWGFQATRKPPGYAPAAKTKRMQILTMLSIAYRL